MGSFENLSDLVSISEVRMDFERQNVVVKHFPNEFLRRVVSKS